MDPKALREEFTGLQASTDVLLTTLNTQKRDFTKDEQATYEKNIARMQEITGLLQKHKQVAELAFAMNGSNVQQFQLPPGEEGDTPEERQLLARFSQVNAAAKKVKRAEFIGALNAWACTGRMINRFATITSTTDNGIMMPIEVDEPIIPSAPNTIREALGIYGLKALSTPTTRTINLPVADASSGGKVAENAGSETENEPSLAQSIQLAVNTYQSGSSWFSNKELMAVDYDLMSALLPALAYSKELALEADVFTTIAGDSGVTQTVATATVSGFTYTNLVTLNRALPKRYNPLKVIALSKAAYTAAENLTTTTGYPILNALNPQNSSLKYFNGTPVVWTDDLSAFGANNVVGLVISLVGFRLRDCGQQQVQRYTQYPARPAQTGFNLYGYHAFGYADSAVAKLVCPAS